MGQITNGASSNIFPADADHHSLDFSFQFVRQANATPYAEGDGIGNAEGTEMVITAAKAPSHTGKIHAVQVWMTGTPTAGIDLFLYLFRGSLAIDAGDNEAFNLLFNAANFIGAVELGQGNAIGTNHTFWTSDLSESLPYVASNAGKLHAVLISGGALTPANTGVIRVTTHMTVD